MKDDDKTTAKNNQAIIGECTEPRHFRLLGEVYRRIGEKEAIRGSYRSRVGGELKNVLQKDLKDEGGK